MKRSLIDHVSGPSDTVTVKSQKLDSVGSSSFSHQTCAIHNESPPIMELIIRILLHLSNLNDKSSPLDAVAVITQIKELYDIGACATNPPSIHAIVSKYVVLWLSHYQTHHFDFCPSNKRCVPQSSSAGCGRKIVRHFLVDILFQCSPAAAIALIEFVSQQILRMGEVQLWRTHLRDYQTPCGETILHYLMSSLCNQLSLPSLRSKKEREVSPFRNILGKISESGLQTQTGATSTPALGDNRGNLQWGFQQHLSKRLASTSTNNKSPLPLFDEMDWVHVLIDVVLWLLRIHEPVFVFETGLLSHQRQPVFPSIFELMIQTNHPYSLPLAQIFYNALPQYAIDSRGVGLSPFLLSVQKFQFKWASWLAGTVPLRHVNLNMDLKHTHSTVVEQHSRFPQTLYTYCQVRQSSQEDRRLSRFLLSLPEERFVLNDDEIFWTFHYSAKWSQSLLIELRPQRICQFLDNLCKNLTQSSPVLLRMATTLLRSLPTFVHVGEELQSSFVRFYATAFQLKTLCHVDFARMIAECSHTSSYQLSVSNSYLAVATESNKPATTQNKMGNAASEETKENDIVVSVPVYFTHNVNEEAQRQHALADSFFHDTHSLPAAAHAEAPIYPATRVSPSFRLSPPASRIVATLGQMPLRLAGLFQSVASLTSVRVFQRLHDTHDEKEVRGKSETDQLNVHNSVSNSTQTLLSYASSRSLDSSLGIDSIRMVTDTVCILSFSDGFPSIPIRIGDRPPHTDEHKEEHMATTHSETTTASTVSNSVSTCSHVGDLPISIYSMYAQVEIHVALESGFSKTHLRVTNVDRSCPFVPLLGLLKPCFLWNVPEIQFDNEPGQGIGVFRDYVNCFLQWVFSSDTGIMQAYGDPANPVYYFSQTTNTKRWNWSQIRLVCRCLGRIYGIMYMHRISSHVRFASYVFRRLCKLTVDESDYKELYPSEHTHMFRHLLTWNDNEYAHSGINLTWPCPRLGQDNQPVAESERSEFSQYLLHDMEAMFAHRQQEFNVGFCDIVPEATLPFIGSPVLLSRRFFVECTLDVEHLVPFVVFPETATDQQKSVFWGALSHMDASQRQKLVSFITGFPSIPLGSMQELCREHKISIEFVAASSPKRLPEARTCFFSLVLFNYKTAEDCAKDLIECISQQTEFRFI